MIVKDNKELQSLYYGRKEISAIYRGLRLVWQAKRSCFSNGFWSNGSPWKNDEAWKN